MSKVTTKTAKATKKVVKVNEGSTEEPVVVESTPVATSSVTKKTKKTEAVVEANTTVATNEATATNEVTATNEATEANEAVEQTGVEVTEVETMKQRFEALIKSKQSFINDVKREIQDLRKMQRDHELAIKEASKRSKRKRVISEDSANRKPSGFASPVVVSDDLYSFLSQFGIKKGDPIARTDVTKYITNYIKEKDLQNPDHRREIVPDAALKKLFGPAIEPKDPNDANSPLVYTYLKLQRYLSPHFPKKST